MSLYARVFAWTLRRNIRTWLSHTSVTMSAVVIHPFVGVGLACWYFERERRQVKASGHGWTVDSICDVLFPMMAASAGLMSWAAGIDASLLGVWLNNPNRS